MNVTWVRRTHRGLAVAFLAAVVITVIGLSVSGPEWLVYLPLIPLAGLFLSGALMFVRLLRGPQPSSAFGGSAGRVRQVHRWSAVVFVVSVVATVIALARPEPIVWVSYLPLIPLAGLFLSGSFMFVSPWVRARRASR
ncbi:hypothetical protein ACFWPK_12045 [Nocardia sp. NPDC058519]|uniref:hypothetical protein n=1 Tax=Nocardia sp. NPDC058519 TaxID=3346535 RepID=UPI003660D831